MSLNLKWAIKAPSVGNPSTDTDPGSDLTASISGLPVSVFWDDLAPEGASNTCKVTGLIPAPPVC